MVEKLRRAATARDPDQVATGQPITTYFNMISRPRQPSELDGPEAATGAAGQRAFAHPRRRGAAGHPALHPLRHLHQLLPGLRPAGGRLRHRLSGPTVRTSEPQRIGIDKVGTLTSACTMCGACGEVCPVKIPLPKLINRLRAEAVNEQRTTTPLLGRGSLRKPGEATIWKLWQQLYAHPRLYRLFTLAATRLRWLTPRKLAAGHAIAALPGRRRAACGAGHSRGIWPWVVQSRQHPRAPARQPPMPFPPGGVHKPLGWDRERCIAGIHDECARCAARCIGWHDDWTAWLNRELPPRGMLRGLIGRGAVAEQFAAAAADEFTLTRYDHAIDDWKDVLFRDIDFSVTGTLAGFGRKRQPGAGPARMSRA